MKRVAFVLIAPALALACSDAATLPDGMEPSFGVEPTPFYPSATNALEAVVHHLEVVQGQVAALCDGPRGCLPDPAIIGQLGAMTNELHALDDRVKAVLGIEPEPVRLGFFELRTAAREVYVAGVRVEDAATEKMGVDPEPFFEAGLLLVIGGAEDVQESVRTSAFCDEEIGSHIPCLPDCGNVSPPSIAPDQGSPGSDFTITDPCGRIEAGDLALFYPQGEDPATGIPATGVSIPQGNTYNGEVPSELSPGVLYYIAVRPNPTAESRFPDLPFEVT